MIKLLYKSKIQWNQSVNCLFNGKEKVKIENLKNPRAFIDYSWKSDGAYENVEDYNPT